MKFFRPEFFNRIDAVVTFQPLSQESMVAITKKELAEVACREGLEKSGLRLDWTEGLVAYLVREGFDTRYGARPLQRALENLLVTPLARFLVEHPQMKNATIRADVGPAGSVTFHTS
jgi:ATP-dependent Clp protease ATP-binding subunit ClpA